MLIEAKKVIRRLIMRKKSAGFSAQRENVRLIRFGTSLVTEIFKNVRQEREALLL